MAAADETLACVRCGAPQRLGATFCGSCGAATIDLGLSLDKATLEHLVVDARGLLRLRLENRSGTATEATLALTLDRQPLPSTAAPTLAPFASTVATAGWTPDAAGFHELAGEIVTGDVHWTISPVYLRVGGEGQPVSITIDQSAARVIDNSRSSFGALPTGGLLGDGDWQPLTLRPVTRPAPAPLPERPTFASIDFTITTSRGRYHASETLARGDLATVYGARDGADLVALKLVDDRADNDLMQHEVDVLAALADPDPAAPSRHFPRARDTFKTGDGRVGTVFDRLDGLDLVELRRRLAARGEHGLAPRHLIWLMRRVFAALGWAHARGILHGNLEPAHILVRPHDHMVWLVDWCWSIQNPAQTGQGFKAKNETYSPPEVAERKPPIPASDIYAFGKCLFFVAGGDPVEKTLPDMDERLARFLKWLVTESPRGRPQDALQLYLQVDKLRAQLWGEHTFVELSL